MYLAQKISSCEAFLPITQLFVMFAVNKLLTHSPQQISSQKYTNFNHTFFVKNSTVSDFSSGENNKNRGNISTNVTTSSPVIRR